MTLTSIGRGVLLPEEICLHIGFTFVQRTWKRHCKLFRHYFYQMYRCSLWYANRQNTMKRLKVTYSKVMRRLMGRPPRCSTIAMFVRCRVHSFQKAMQIVSNGLRGRVGNSECLVPDTSSLGWTLSKTKIILCINRISSVKIGLICLFSFILYMAVQHWSVFFKVVRRNYFFYLASFYEKWTHLFFRILFTSWDDAPQRFDEKKSTG